MPGATQRRLVEAFLAYLMGIATRIIVQLATLPILFAHWSAGRVGSWMLVFALPTYFNVMGGAFASAGGNLALDAARNGRWEAARAAFRASWLWASIASFAIAGFFVLAASWTSNAELSHLGLEGIDDLRECALWLGLYVIAIAQGAVMLVPMRVGEVYPRYYSSQNLANLAEVAVIAICVSRSESFADLAFAMALLRAIVALGLALLARRACPQMFSGAQAGFTASLAGLAAPSTAFMVLPMVYLLNLQGYTLIVGLTYGATLVAGFVTTRVIVRAIDLAMSVIYASQFNEAGYLGTEKRAIQQRQLATMTMVTLAGVGVFSAVILTIGPWFQALLSAGKSSFDPAIALVLLASGLIRALATTPQALVAADNKHIGFALRYLAISLACLPVAAGLALAGTPLAVVLLMLIPAELGQTLPAFRAALDHVGWGKRDLLGALFHRDRLADIRDLGRFLVQRG